MDGASFTAWKVAEFIQNLANMDTELPPKWKNYPASQYAFGGKYLTGLDPDDKKYLRVYYEVLERYPREKFKFEEEQIDVLKDIRDRLPVAPCAPATTAAAPAASPVPADRQPTGTPGA